MFREAGRSLNIQQGPNMWLLIKYYILRDERKNRMAGQGNRDLRGKSFACELFCYNVFHILFFVAGCMQVCLEGKGNQKGILDFCSFKKYTTIFLYFYQMKKTRKYKQYVQLTIKIERIIEFDVRSSDHIYKTIFES